MKITEKLTPEEARFLFISSQLLADNKSAKDKVQLQKIIEQIGYVQIDTISIVERSHHHILWSRMNSYLRSMLDELIEYDKTIFEYWSHAAAYLPIKDYRYSLIRKNNYSRKYKTWGSANKKTIKQVYDRIKSEGALQSKDFEDPRTKSEGWWDWKPSKDALDFLFHKGELMIAKRKGFQKVYDLTERVLPANTDTTFPTEKEFYKHLISNSIKANGLVTDREIAYLRNYDRKLFSKVIEELLENQNIFKVSIKGFENGNYFTNHTKLELLNERKKHSEIHILSPFDNLVIQRKRLKEFFGFDYQIECYLPAAKRKFGYFCMPVLYGDKLIGKIDAKALRQNKIFIVKKIFWEEKTKLNEKILKKIEKKLNEFAKFTGCDETEGLDFKNKLK
ncbi:MAG: winged helix DNA-binding domain-containing protein [Bacteroidota bacterium]|nr:winged helix DNA-binding domain-containing protein [Bacteroidota bacterium]